MQPAFAAEDRFAIKTFAVQGNTLLPEKAVAEAVKPFTGENRDFGDIQRALEALELAYRKAGYGAVQVSAPEQEVTGGTVRLQVTEVPIDKVVVSGNKAFSLANIRNSLPSLHEGRSVNTLELSRDIQIANENPAKKLDTKLAVGERENTVDATVNVSEDEIDRLHFSLDNTGNRDSGYLRLSASYQHANLWDRDHTLSLSYITSPDKPSDAKLDVYAIGYRIPLYQRRESLDFLYAYSDSTAPVSALGTTLAGKGTIYSVKWSSHLPRFGEYSSRYGIGFDNKIYSSSAALHNTEFQLLSAFYAGRLDSPGRLLDYQASYAYNIGPDSAERYTEAAGGRASRRDFSTLRLQGSYMHTLPRDWMFRLGFNAQHSPGVAIPSAEQISLAGMSAVRGFLERAVSADGGVVGNFEFYTPELAPSLGAPGNLRLLAFFDYGAGWNYETTHAQRSPRISSYGLGARYNLDKTLSFRLDMARINHVHPEGINNDASGLDTKTPGDWRGHFTLTYSY